MSELNRIDITVSVEKREDGFFAADATPCALWEGDLHELLLLEPRVSTSYRKKQAIAHALRELAERIEATP